MSGEKHIAPIANNSLARMGTPVFNTGLTLGALLEGVLVADTRDLRIRQVQAEKDCQSPKRFLSPVPFSLSPAGSRNPSLHEFGFLGRCPGLERLRSQGSSFLIQYPCAFFSLFSHSFMPYLLSHNLRAASACYFHYPASKKLSLPASRAEIH